MNVNVWNIKDMFSIPPGAGASKSSGLTSTSSDFSSLTDSQFIFGSQFCPDISQLGSTELTSHAKQQNKLQHNSQDSDPSVYMKYQTKPQLYTSDFKERSSILPLVPGKPKGIFELYEQDKKKVKEKYDNEQLNNFVTNIQESMQGLKKTFCQFEENTNARCKTIMDSVQTSSKALQDTAATHHGSILKALSNNNMEQSLLDFEKKIHTKVAEITDLTSNVQLLLVSLDVLKSKQCEQHLELSEKVTWLSDYIKFSENKLLNELQKIKLVPQSAVNLKDNATQTCPTISQDLSMKHNNKSQFKTIKTCSYSSPLSQTDGHSRSNRTHNTLSTTLSLNLNSNKNVGALQTSIKKKKALQHKQDENGKCKSRKLNKLYEHNNGPCKGKENILFDMPKKNTQKIKRRRASNQKRKKAFISMKNNSDLIPKSLVKNLKGTFEEESWNEKDTELESPKNNLVFYSDSCDPSLSVIHAPLRMVQQKNKEHFSALYSHKSLELFSSIEEETCAEEKLGISKTEQKLVPLNFSSENSHVLQYSIKSENWLLPSSPLTNSTKNPVVLHTDQKTFMTLFFDSSDDSE